MSQLSFLVSKSSLKVRDQDPLKPGLPAQHNYFLECIFIESARWIESLRSRACFFLSIVESIWSLASFRPESNWSFSALVVESTLFFAALPIESSESFFAEVESLELLHAASVADTRTIRNSFFITFNIWLKVFCTVLYSSILPDSYFPWTKTKDELAENSSARLFFPEFGSYNRIHCGNQSQ